VQTNMDSSWEVILEALLRWIVNVQWWSHLSRAGVRNLHVRMMEATTRNNAKEGNVIVLIAMEDNAAKKYRKQTVLIVQMLEISIIQIKLQNFVIQ